MVAVKEGDTVRLISRAGKDHSHRFPGLVEAIRALRYHTLTLDGEVARYDAQLISRFEWLRSDPQDEVATPPMFMAFDLLQLDEANARAQPLHARRRLLERVLNGAPALLLPVRRQLATGCRRGNRCLSEATRV